MLRKRILLTAVGTSSHLKITIFNIVEELFIGFSRKDVQLKPIYDIIYC